MSLLPLKDASRDMEKWLEDQTELSEEWNSQPRSSSPRSSVNTVVSQSSVVAPRSTSMVTDENAQRKDGEAAAESSDRVVSPKRVLAEKTTSDINKKSNASSLGLGSQSKTSKHKRSSSTAPAESVVQYDSIARRSQSSSPARKTPEWKQLAMRAAEGAAHQQDLFSPIGLEGMFKKPGQKDSRQRTELSNKSFGLWRDGNIPSSPPPWPSEFRENAPLQHGRSTNGRQPSGLMFSSIHEHMREERPAAQDYNEAIDLQFKHGHKDGEGEPNISEERHMDPAVASSGAITEKEEEVAGHLASAEGHVTSDDFSKACLDTIPITSKRMVSVAISGTGSSRISSFSPVFVSKHNSSDGQVRYSALDSTNSKVMKQMRSIQESPSKRQTAHSVESGSAFTSTDNSPPRHTQGSTKSGTMAPISGFVNVERGNKYADNSFMRRPLSPSASSSVVPSDSISQVCYKADRVGASRVLNNPVASKQRTTPPQSPSPSSPRIPHTPQNDSSKVQPASNKSPLKLFGNYDTFTNGRLMDRMCQLDKSPTSHEQQISESHITDKSNDDVFLSPSQRHRREKSSSTLKTAVLVPPVPVVQLGLQPRPSSRIRSESLSSLDSVLRSSSSGEAAPVINELEIQRDEAVVSSTDQSFAKRPAPAPFKHPTPKRQRTLCKDDMASRDEYVSATVQEEFRRMQNAVQSHVVRDDAAPPNERLATESMHAPSPAIQSSPNSQTLDEPPFENEEEEASFLSIASQLEVVRDALPHDRTRVDVQALASGIATLRINVTARNTRKHSVSTQDYVDEAMKIMDLIRSRREPQSFVSLGPGELGTPTEHAAGHDTNRADGEPGTTDCMSKPSSLNEDFRAWRPRGGAQPNARILSHLRKYQETGDESFIMSSIAKAPEETHVEETILDAVEEELSSDSGNIRITQSQKAQSNIRSPDNDCQEQDTTRSNFKTGSSDPSTDSTGRTVQTMTSQRNKSLPVIRPHRVSHLIQTEQAGMRFDAQKQSWVKCKMSSPQKEKSSNISSSTGTEEDPFGQIPDLSIYEVNEVHHFHKLATQHEETPAKKSPIPATLSPRDAIKYFNSLNDIVTSASGIRTQSEKEAHLEYESGTSNTGGDKAQGLQRPSSPGMAENETSRTEGVHRTIMSTTNAFVPKKSRPSVCFSSPLVADKTTPKVQWNVREDQSDCSDESYDEDVEDINMWRAKSATAIPQAVSKKEPSLPSCVFDVTARNMSLTRIDERHELSVIETRPDGRHFSLTLSVSTPVPARHGTLQSIIPSSISRNAYSCHSLSPLSEFTLHQDDQAHLESQQLVHSGQALLRPDPPSAPAVVISELVEKLHDVEPEEPYWDWMHVLNLAGKSLDNLHMLQEFCPRLEELDASDNRLSQLSGAPFGLRRLNASNNQLSSLTGWSQFMHMQFLDLSNNGLDSLDGLSTLIHLRELKVDDNCITSLDGVTHLDCLTKLSLKRNRLENLDIRGAQLQSLGELDVSGNLLTGIQGLESLSQLTRLNVSKNKLKALLTARTDEAAPAQLQVLDCCDNDIESMDTSGCSRLEAIFADNNKLSRIQGLATLGSVHTLSIRNQTAPSSLLTYFNDFSEMRHLYFSGNSVQSLPMSSHFLNLQTLELASTGLQSLPAGFSTLAPNLRVLNVNSNALKDLRPLRGIVKLRELHAAGNRISRLRKTMAVAETFRELEVLDLRHNPFSVGFYAPIEADARGVQTLVSPEDVASDDKPSSSRLGHTLPLLDTKRDQKHVEMLDEDTRLRRRVYELLLATKCAGLERLDGLDFAKDEATAKDDVWQRLVALGVIERKSERTIERQL